MDLTLRQPPRIVLTMSKLLDQIREAVDASGTTRSLICKATGITPPHMSKLMKGERGLSVENLERLAKYLGLEITLQPKGHKGR